MSLYWRSCVTPPMNEKFYLVSDIYNQEFVCQFIPVPPDGGYEWVDKEGIVHGSITHYKRASSEKTA